MLEENKGTPGKEQSLDRVQSGKVCHGKINILAIVEIDNMMLY